MKIALVIFITLALAGCALLSLHMGVIPVPWRALLTDWQAGREHYYVLMEYRLPRLLLALFVGAALAVAGVLIQGIVRNPLASPDILGVNHAASLASVGALLLMPSLPVMVLPLLAFAGGMAGVILLKMLAKTHQPMKRALTRVALSACRASPTGYLVLSRPPGGKNPPSQPRLSKELFPLRRKTIPPREAVPPRGGPPPPPPCPAVAHRFARFVVTHRDQTGG